jgi:hypothetical protein
MKPIQPLLERSQTPPGLSSFGSPEAIQLFALPGTLAVSAYNAQGRPLRRSTLSVAVIEQDSLPPAPPAIRPLDRAGSSKGKSVIR